MSSVDIPATTAPRPRKMRNVPGARTSAMVSASATSSHNSIDTFAPRALRGSRFGQLGDPGDRADDRARLQRHEHDLVVARLREPAERLDIFGGDAIVYRLHVARGDRLGDDARRAG